MIVVFGSINMDISMRLKSFPAPGETVLSPAYDMSPGGKGANQAMAAARMGAKTAMVGKVGDDGMGNRMTQNLRRNEVMTSGVAVSDYLPTGIAFVVTNAHGENQIIVASGANSDVSEDQIPDEILKEGNILLLQMEAPPEQNVILMKRAKEHGATVILNLAPFFPLPVEALSLADWLIVNETESASLAKTLGITQAGPEMLARSFAKSCHNNCIVTLGAHGSLAALRDGTLLRAAALPVEKPVDTTGAGDCFCGTFAGALHARMPVADALNHASAAAGLSCQKAGAQDSYPYKDEVSEAARTLPPVEPI